MARRKPCSLPCLPLLYGHPSMTAVGSEDGRKLEKQSGFPISFSLSHLLADGFIIGTALFRMSEKKAKWTPAWKFSGRLSHLALPSAFHSWKGVPQWWQSAMKSESCWRKNILAYNIPYFSHRTGTKGGLRKVVSLWAIPTRVCRYVQTDDEHLSVPSDIHLLHGLAVHAFLNSS